MSVFGPEVVSTDRKILNCKMYDVNVGTTKRFNVTQYLPTEKQKISCPKRKKCKYIQIEIFKMHIIGI